MVRTIITSHCAELDRCNQRCERMLSIFDLLAAGTLDLELATFLMARIFRGASFMVGARPGGAGKTTVMCALLNLVPPDMQLTAATGAVVRNPSNNNGRICYISHEIGAGHFFAYLWGADLRAYCALGESGLMLATNLHADDLDEARNQVCKENRVPESQFNAFRLVIFLRVAGRYLDARRWIEKVYLSDGQNPHQLVFDVANGLRHDSIPDAGEFAPEYLAQCRAFLEAGVKGKLKTIEATRTALLESPLSHLSH